MTELDTETTEFLRAALEYTPASDLSFMLENVDALCTRAGFVHLLLQRGVEVTDRAHQMEHDVDGHRYFSIPLQSDASLVHITKLHASEEVQLIAEGARVRPYTDRNDAWLVRADESVVRVSRGSGDNWYVTRITGGPLVPNEEVTLNKDLVGKKMSAADAKELGFEWVRVPALV